MPDLNSTTVVSSDRFDSLRWSDGRPARFLAFDGQGGLPAVATDWGVLVLQSTRFGPGAGRESGVGPTPLQFDTWSLATSDTHAFTTAEDFVLHRVGLADGSRDDVP